LSSNPSATKNEQTTELPTLKVDLSRDLRPHLLRPFVSLQQLGPQLGWLTFLHVPVAQVREEGHLSRMVTEKMVNSAQIQERESTMYVCIYV
jgi:hypothetical protein